MANGLEDQINKQLKSVLVIKSDKGFGFGIHKENPVVINKVTPNGPADKAGVRIGDEIVCVEGRTVLESPHEVVANMIKSKRQVRLVLRTGSCSSPNKKKQKKEASNHKESRSGDFANFDRRPSAVSADFNGEFEGSQSPQSNMLKFRRSIIGLPHHWRFHKPAKTEENCDTDSQRSTVSKSEDCAKIMEDQELLPERTDIDSGVGNITAETADNQNWPHSEQQNPDQVAELIDLKSSSSDSESSRSQSPTPYSDTRPPAGMDTVDSVQQPIGTESVSEVLETVQLSADNRSLLTEEDKNGESAQLSSDAVVTETDSNELNRRDPLRQSRRRTPHRRHKTSLSSNSGRPKASIVREADYEDEAPAADSFAAEGSGDIGNQPDDKETADAELKTEPGAETEEQKENGPANADEAEEEEDEDPDIHLSQFVAGSTAQMPVSDAAESTLKALLDVFSDVQQMKQNKPVLMLFLHLLLSRPNQNAPGARESLRPLLFDLLVDDWVATSASLKPKHARRAAYEIYSTFLHPQAPLSLSVAMRLAELDPANSSNLDGASQTFSRLLETSGQDESMKRQLGAQLATAQAAIQPALSRLAASAGVWLRARQRDGFDALGGGDFLPPGTDSAIASLLRSGVGGSSDAQRLLTAKLRPFMLEHLRHLRQQPSAVDQLTASCLATVLAHNLKVGLVDTGASVDSLMSAAAAAASVDNSSSSASSSGEHHSAVGQQLFNCQRGNGGGGGGGSGGVGGIGLGGRQRLSILAGIGGRSEKVRIGSHSVELASFDSIRHCFSCQLLLSGPGPQGYLCGGECGQAVHRQKECTDKLANLQCKRSSNKSSASIGKAKSFRGKREHRDIDSSMRKVSASQLQLHQLPEQPQSKNNGYPVSPLPVAQTPPPSLEIVAAPSESDTVIAPSTPTSANRLGFPASIFGGKRPASMILPTDHSDQALADEILVPPPASLPAARSEQNVGPLDEDESLPRTGSFSRELMPPTTAVAVVRSSSDRETTGTKVDHVRFASTGDKKEPEWQRQQLYQLVSSHENFRGVASDFSQYIVQHKVGDRLQQIRSADDLAKSDFDRFKDYQLALHEIVFTWMSHVRALTVLDLLFVRTWPDSCQEIMKQLGLHFVPRCIEFYKNLLLSVGKPSLEEFSATGKITNFGKRLLDWYSADRNFLNFKLLSLSFGFSRSSRNSAGGKRSTGNEDDLILRLDSMRRENAELNRFIQLAEQHEAAQRLDFKAYYSVNMQFTMRMFLLLQTAVKSAKKAKSSCKFAEKDLPDLEKCQEKAKMVVDYSNFTSVRLKELSRQLVLSSSFKSFWVRCKLDKDHVDRVRDQISHLHTCQLVQTREVAMPGFENYRLRLLVFSEFLLIVSETEETKGVVKYQLLRHLGQSMSVGGPGNSEASDVGSGMGSLRAVSCPPIIPMTNVIHVFEGRQQKSTSAGGRQATEFRMVIDHPSTSRTESLLIVFNLRKDKPRMPFSDRETDTSASDIVESIKLLQAQFKASAPGMDRSGSVNSLGSVTSAPAAIAGSSASPEEASASSARDSALPEEREDEIAAQEQEQQQQQEKEDEGQAAASSGLTLSATEADSHPDSSDYPSSPSTPVAGDAASASIVDEAQIDSLSARQMQLLPELRQQLCSVLQLESECFDMVAECAQESNRPDTKEGVLIAYKQFEQLLETLPRLMKAMLPSAEPGAAEMLLDQLAAGTSNSAKLLRQISASAIDTDVDVGNDASASAVASQEEAHSPDSPPSAPPDNSKSSCSPDVAAGDGNEEKSQLESISFELQSESPSKTNQQPEQAKESLTTEQGEHGFTDRSLSMTHSDDEERIEQTSLPEADTQTELFSLSIEQSGRDLLSREPPLVDGDPDASPVFGHCEPATQLPDSGQPPSDGLSHPD